MSYRDPFDVAQQCLLNRAFAESVGPLYSDVFTEDPIFRASAACEVRPDQQLCCYSLFLTATDEGQQRWHVLVGNLSSRL